MTTKAARIMALYDGTRSTKDIGAEVGCSAAYVRVVAHQRKGGGKSAIDRRYLASKHGERLKALDRAYVREFHKTIRKTGDRDAAHKAANEVRSAAHQAGKSADEVHNQGRSAYWQELRETSDLVAAREAGRKARRRLAAQKEMKR